MSKKIHCIPISTKDYDAIISNVKHFHLIKDDDCDYYVGDFVIFQEYENEKYTKRETGFKIECILRDCLQSGLAKGYCILGW